MRWNRILVLFVTGVVLLQIAGAKVELAAQATTSDVPTTDPVPHHGIMGRAFAKNLAKCNAGDGGACDHTGFALAYGWGVDKDPQMAEQFYEKSCALGSKRGCSDAKYGKTRNKETVSGTAAAPGTSSASAPEAASTQAQTPAASPSPETASEHGVASTLSVAGVKLGMTPDQAIAALRSYGTWGVLEKRYGDGPSYTSTGPWWEQGGDSKIQGLYGELGMADNCKTRGGAPYPRPHFLVSIIAARAKRIPGPGPAWPDTPFFRAKPAQTSACIWAGTPVGAKPGEDPEEVFVYLSPIPGKEHVIGVSLWTSFHNMPTLDDVIAAGEKRYPMKPTSIYMHNSIDTYSVLSWRFDAHGALIRTSQMPNAHLDTAGFNYGKPQLPGYLRVDGGVGLDFVVLPAPPGLAGGYSISLYSDNDLFAFTLQLAALEKTLEQQRQKEIMDKAKQNTVVIK